MNKGKVVGIAVASLVAYTLALGFLSPASSPLQTSSKISSGGAVKAIGVMAYSDADCTSKLVSIDWGVLEPGGNKSVTCFLRNEGNYAITVSLFTENWSPSNASEYITLGWDYGGQSISPSEILKVILSLSVSASIHDITDFTFDIIIVGSG